MTYHAEALPEPDDRAQMDDGSPDDWVCPFCGKDFGPHPDPHPHAIACCGEVGHLIQRRDDEG
jgi:hypothetical protein